MTTRNGRPEGRPSREEDNVESDVQAGSRALTLHQLAEDMRRVAEHLSEARQRVERGALITMADAADQLSVGGCGSYWLDPGYGCQLDEGHKGLHVDWAGQEWGGDMNASLADWLESLLGCPQCGCTSLDPIAGSGWVRCTRCATTYERKT